MRTRRMRNLTPYLRATALLLSLSLARTLPAQRVIHETAAEYQRAKPLTVSSIASWCTAADDAGCDFKSIDNATLLSDGGIVASSRTGPIRHFAPKGTLIGALARKGSGPGEYGLLMSMQLVNDRVVWFDPTQMRIASVTLKNVPGKTVTVRTPITTSMTFLNGETLVVLDIPASKDTGVMVQASYHTVPPTGTPRILAVVRTPSKFFIGAERLPPTGPLAITVLADVGSDLTIAHSNGLSYAVELFPAGSATFTIECAAPVRDLTQSDRDSVLREVAGAYRVPNARALPPRVRTQIEKIQAFPALTAIRLLRDGTIWIRPTPMRGDTLARWDVFRADGTRIGQVHLAISARVRDGTRDWILVTEVNDDDAPRVVKYLVH